MICDSFFEKHNKRIAVVTGHYGSGKTEFAVSLAMLMSKERTVPYSGLALIDLDVANPYFRSRERRKLLEENGIGVYGSAYESEITAELPALGASLRKPLEDPDCFVIVDAGGNDSGALVLNQFRKYFIGSDSVLLCVINANRPETRDISGAEEHLESIERTTGIRAGGLINNCHLLMETTAATVKKGHELCLAVSSSTGIPLIFDCYPSRLVKGSDIESFSSCPLPVGMYMRETWLDK